VFSKYLDYYCIVNITKPPIQTGSNLIQTKSFKIQTGSYSIQTGSALDPKTDPRSLPIRTGSSLIWIIFDLDHLRSGSSSIWIIFVMMTFPLKFHLSCSLQPKYSKISLFGDLILVMSRNVKLVYYSALLLIGSLRVESASYCNQFFRPHYVPQIS